METKVLAFLAGLVLFATNHSASSQTQEPSACAGPNPAGLSAPPAGDAAAKSIPFDQLGAEAQKQYTGDGVGITPTADGARLRAAFQDLAADATPDGLWLESTADEDTGKPTSFRVRAMAIGREGNSPFQLTSIGQVRPTCEAALYLRLGLIEEYTVSMDGVRQDFVLPQRPAGTGELRVELAVDGARAGTAAYGVKLTLAGNGREIAYSRLHVADANGRELTARFEATNASHIQIRVDDHNATYPIRIDPTFSDADWSTLGSGMNGPVYALAVSGTDLYAGGGFTTAGGISAKYIAKWDGTGWSAMGDPAFRGMSSAVYALAVSGTNLYAGGGFNFAGGVAASRIARWDGITWWPLGEGLNGSVYVMAISGTDLYVGGNFTTAGGVGANYIAKWDGGWRALGSGMNNAVDALAVSITNPDDGGFLYAGGHFTTAGGVNANYIAKWTRYNWFTLGSGMNGSVNALTVSTTGPDDGGFLYAGGGFTTAGGVNSNYIAKWSLGNWTALGSGANYNVDALAISGSDLYAAGRFTTAGGVGANYIAKWNGSVWSALGSGMSSGVYALSISGAELYVGGDFTTAGGKSAAYIAKAAMLVGPEIEVEQLAGVPLVDGSSAVFGSAPVGTSGTSKIFTVRSTGTLDLTLATVTTSGGNAGDFSVDTTDMASTVTPGSSTTFSVTFSPTGPGGRGTTLQIFSNDEDESPFDITLSGTGLSFTNDGDGDGLNDASEFKMAALGFIWDLPQPELVTTYYNSANGAGLYTTSQVQALHIDTPLIQRDGAGLFTLTLGLQKSATLLPGSFQPFSFTDGTTQINGGKIEFQFTSPHNAAFFRVEGR